MQNNITKLNFVVFNTGDSLGGGKENSGIAQINCNLEKNCNLAAVIAVAPTPLRCCHGISDSRRCHWLIVVQEKLFLHSHRLLQKQQLLQYCHHFVAIDRPGRSVAGTMCVVTG